MLVPTPPQYRQRRGRATKKQPAGPAALMLVQAELVLGDPTVLRLEFDRAIDVGGLDASQVVVQYPSGTGFEYVGTSVADTPGPEIVDIAIVENGPAQGTQDVLSATADTGIVAVNDGGTWPGVNEAALPFP